LKYDDGMLIFTRGKSEDGFWTLNIYKSDGNGDLIEMKILKVTPENHELDPQSILQLDNGDIIFNCIDRNNDYSDILIQPTAEAWIYFRAEDLKISTFINKEIVESLVNIKLHPNPTKDILNITTEKLYFNKIIIFDMVGRIVYLRNIISNVDYSLNIGFLNKGIYITKVYNDNIEVGKGKIFKE
jgi:hypothetical protein